ncbi:hypothetical protein BT96DRAFT_279918 [Gymnopus androsaceus JB14]|uniref:Uncharacterized protein n=1 Tax=Gymnopus androsaceus JB14 TaxID=1447944 RepID=A0A6A4I696_9AGAR|nr:hypothetical protein BT96DRAFT_279918 [Gymnopus androsaceus JB14]
MEEISVCRLAYVGQKTAEDIFSPYPEITNILGTTRMLNCPNSDTFHQELLPFVTGGQLGKGFASKEVSSGPCTSDANSARNSITEKYIEKSEVVKFLLLSHERMTTRLQETSSVRNSRPK